MSATPSVTNLPENRQISEFALIGELLLTKAPPPPPDLNAEGIMWWNYYTELMVETKILSRFFLTSLHNLCILHMLREHVKNELNRSGQITITNVKTIKDDIVTTITINPLIPEMQRIVGNMDRLLSSLGMTLMTSKSQNINLTGDGPRKRSKPPKPFTPEESDFETIPFSMEMP